MGQDELDILVVDDDRDLLDMLQEHFTELGLRIATAQSVGEARDRLAHFSFKIVLSDHNLPDGNGVDFLAEMQGMGVKSVPILMTGFVEVNVAIEAINRGKVFRFVPKPLDLAALVQIVQRALDNYSSQREWERMMRGFVEHSDRLQRDAQVKEQSLRDAAERIRSEEETVERQKVHIESLYAEIQEAYLHTVTSLTAAIEAKDRYTHGHAERVYYYCTLMADVLGLSESDRKDLRFASVLHDLGKIGIPDSILRKPGRLSAEEHRVMQTHPLLTEKILGPLPFMENVKRIIREHHERFDGQGYPNGIKGDVISVEGRILAVADAYDAMRSDRPYRKALGMADALTELQAGAGTQFCPLCVGALSFALAGRGELAEADASQQRSAEGEDELIRLRPASETVHIESLFN